MMITKDSSVDADRQTLDQIMFHLKAFISEYDEAHSEKNQEKLDARNVIERYFMDEATKIEMKLKEKYVKYPHEIFPDDSPRRFK